MAGNAIQVGPDGAIRIKDNGIVVAGDSDKCCCDDGEKCPWTAGGTYLSVTYDPPNPPIVHSIGFSTGAQTGPGAGGMANCFDITFWATGTKTVCIIFNNGVGGITRNTVAPGSPFTWTAYGDPNFPGPGDMGMFNISYTVICGPC